MLKGCDVCVCDVCDASCIYMYIYRSISIQDVEWKDIVDVCGMSWEKKNLEGGKVASL